MGDSAWGHPRRSYAVPAGQAVAFGGRSEEREGRRWEESLEKAAPGIRDSVERTYKQWNTILRDYLRTETALRLSVGEDVRAVPVHLVEGMPRRLAEVMREFEHLDWLLLNRPAVDQAVSGTGFMLEMADGARRAWVSEAGTSDANEIRRVHETANVWIAKLDEARAVQRICEIDEDVLGAYFFRVPEIRLYWVVIGIMSRILAVSVEALTVVVLAHELAHAYTHLGRDIDNERWDTEWLAATDIGIVEGLGQFYTHVLCSRLGPRMPGALATFKALLREQSAPYKTFREWVGDDERGGEIVRVSMIECRSRGIRDASDFADAVKRHRSGVRGGKK